VAVPANGDQVRVKIALADIMSGKSPDIDLVAGDVLEVPHTASTRRARVGDEQPAARAVRPSAHLRSDPVLLFRSAARDNNGRGSFGQAISDSLRFAFPHPRAAGDAADGAVKPPRCAGASPVRDD